MSRNESLTLLNYGSLRERAAVLVLHAVILAGHSLLHIDRTQRLKRA